jgi:hypothetical protein
MIEPCVEFGCRDLEVVQRLRRQLIEPSFACNAEDLRLPHRLISLRKSAQGRSALARELDQVAALLRKRSFTAARAKLDSIEGSR